VGTNLHRGLHTSFIGVRAAKYLGLKRYEGNADLCAYSAKQKDPQLVGASWGLKQVGLRFVLGKPD
jgi:hypothetical protein